MTVPVLRRWHIDESVESDRATLHMRKEGERRVRLEAAPLRGHEIRTRHFGRNLSMALKPHPFPIPFGRSGSEEAELQRP